MVVSENLNGYVTKDRMWAAVPFGKSKFIIIHNGQQVHVTNNLINAKSYITKQTIVLKNKTSSLEQFL
jgi:hypothetical protein